MNTYLLINLAIIIFPLAFSLEKRIAYYKKLPAVLASIILVGAFFIAWDVYVTERGDWAFNPEHVLGIKLLGLPVEEMLFFFTAPYSCLFVYESIRYFFKEKKVVFDDRLILLAALSVLALSFMNFQREYTFIVLLVTGLLLLCIGLFYRGLAHSGRYWLYIAITFMLFFVFNYLLTSIPVVTYNPAAVTNIRITTIPIEDLFYNYSLLSMNLIAYLEALKRLR